MTSYIWFRQVALFHRHRLPVLTVLVLLRREANSPSLTGTFDICMPDGWQTNRYNYRVVRMWREEPEPYLTAGVNLVPLAPLANVTELALPALVQRMAARINAEIEPRRAKLWTATYLLMGLCYSDELVAQLLEGVQNMQESTTYQAILREGRKEGLIEGRVSEAQRFLLLQGEIRFGKPDDATRSTVEAIHELERLERMGQRVLDANIRDWDDLLLTPRFTVPPMCADPEPRAAKPWAATHVLMGLHCADRLASPAFEGVRNMQESTTYQAILKEGRNEGRVSEAQRLLLLQGEIRFGKPDDATRSTVEAIRELERLEQMGMRLLDANIRDWDALLGAS